MRAQVETLVTELRDELGDSLHGVFYGDFVETNYSVTYLHDDVRDQFSSAEIRKILDTITEEQIDLHDHDELAHLVGDVEITIRLFEHSAHVLAWNPRENEGVFVGLAPDPMTFGPTVEAFRNTIDA
ncbi:hypothetical protein [Haladaptatus sp. DFWS20]|uniref:hypothetical protein n=1 Tax=Haladaptatus sp. DFWS20 TaxID=3403467 RepID=UPI003EB6B52F